MPTRGKFFFARRALLQPPMVMLCRVALLVPLLILDNGAVLAFAPSVRRPASFEACNFDHVRTAAGHAATAMTMTMAPSATSGAAQTAPPRPDHERQLSAPMAVVPPPHDDDDDNGALELLRRLDARLKEDGVRRHFDDLIERGDPSVRHIQAGRYEVFVQADGYDSAAFDWVASKAFDDNNHHYGGLSGSVAAVKRTLLEYARNQADAIGRYRGQSYCYHNFSLLVTYDACPQQHPHIDLLDPNAQFGLIITDESPGTVWFEPSHAIASAQDLQRAWQQAAVEPCDNSASDTDWVTAMESNDKVCHLLRTFGNVLSPGLRAREPYHGAPLATGTLLSLPGGVVHAGPACDDFRAVLFFTAFPEHTSDVAPYHVDTQYFASVLLSDVIAAVWDGLDVRDRVYLLGRLAEYLLQAPAGNRNMHKHLAVGSSMYEFAGLIETGMVSSGDAKFSQLLEEFARQEHLRW